MLRLCYATTYPSLPRYAWFDDYHCIPRSSACNAWTTYTLMVPRQHYTRHLNPWEADQSQCSQWWLYSPQQYCYKIQELRNVRKVRTSCIMHHTGMNTVGLFSWGMSFELLLYHDCSLTLTMIQCKPFSCYAAPLSVVYNTRELNVYIYMKWTENN